MLSPPHRPLCVVGNVVERLGRKKIEARGARRSHRPPRAFYFSIIAIFNVIPSGSVFGGERLVYTAISTKVVGKNVHATIPKCSMGYDQYNVPNDCSCRTYFCCFPLALANMCLWPLVPFFQISLKRVHSKPPTIPFGIVACTFSENLSRNSCMSTPANRLNSSLSLWSQTLSCHCVYASLCNCTAIIQ